MRRIGIVTDCAESTLGKFLQRNLAEVFSGFVESVVYSFAELQPGQVIEDDVVLVMLPVKALEIRPYVKNSGSVVVIQRTLQENAVFRLFEIPKGSRAIVVNDTPETTLETVALLYRLGLDHLELLPYFSETDSEAINIAITPGEAELVPPSIESVINLGHRCIDISTFLQIMNRLGMEERELDRRLVKYGEGIVTLDGGIKKRYKELYMKNVSLDTVVNLSTEGLLLLDRQGRVLLCNASLQRMFDFSSPEDLSEADLPQELRDFLRQGRVKEKILQYQGRSLIMTRQDVEQFGEISGTYLKVQEVTYIRQLEENLSLRLQEKGLQARYSFKDILTQSPKVRLLLERAAKMAASDLTVLITGESGTGKELLAQSLHNHSPRAKQPFVALNCAAVPESLLESELFGYEAGAFTGARKEGKAGLFEQANHGTVFLDEIGDMPHALQARLLRVLQERQVMRVGSQRLINVNIRVIAATNRDLQSDLNSGSFRRDLYYRINVLPLVMPSLRERREDILLLFAHFLKNNNRRDLELSAGAADKLRSYDWPGNVRELANAAAYLSFLPDKLIEEHDLPHYIGVKSEVFNQEKKLLEARLDEALQLLRIFEELQRKNRGAGRKQLENELRQREIFLAEGEIRRVLELLAETGMIRSSVGRGGSRITAKGSDFLNRFNDESRITC